MLTCRSKWSWIGRQVTAAVLAVSAVWGTCDPAYAADRMITASTDTFDCGSANPGDTLTLAAGVRGALTIRNCKGTDDRPIVIRNDAGGTSPTIIRRTGGSSGGFLFSCNNCVGVAIDGSGKWRGAPSGKTYGIQITMTGGGAPSAFLRVGGLSRFVTIRNVEIDGKWPALAKGGSGIRMNDLQVRRSANPGLWREGILIEGNYVHDIANEGMYIGANYNDGDLPLRNIEIRNNLVEDIGWEGINTKSMWSGDNRIHHNVVRRAGKNGISGKPTQYSGINNNGGSVKIYNNWIEATGQHGIQSWTQSGPRISENRGPFEAQIWNNVIVDAGALWRPFMAKSSGINIGAQKGCEKPLPRIFNNTIVNSRQSAISLTSNVGQGFVRDNIAAGTGGNPVIKAPGFIEVRSNTVGAVSTLDFADPSRDDFRLKVGSPARNQATENFPDHDFEDVSRPRDGAADQGAFEGGGK